MTFTITKQKKKFYRDLGTLVLPITIQNLINAAVNSADVFMLGLVSQAALSAVSLANQIQFLTGGFFYGLGSATTMLVAQYWGRRDKKSIQAVMGIALKISLGVMLLVSVLTIGAPRAIMTLFTNDQELIGIGASYLRLIGFSYLMMGISQVYEVTMRSMERAAFATACSSVALVLNICLNAVFIFGLFGAPKMGVTGVAVATLIARSVELILCLADAVISHTLQYEAGILFGRHPALRKDFLRFAAPALVNDLSWSAAFSTYSIILGHMGADVVAASAVATTVRDLFTTVCYGMGSAGTVLLGKELGENRMEDAKSNASSLCHVTLVVSALLGLCIILARPLIFRIFVLSDTARDYLNFMLLVSSYYVVGQAMNTLVIAGVFRAGGDSKFGMICDSVTMWCIAVPLGFFCAFVLKVPVKVEYFILCLDEFWKMPVVYKNYKNYHWLKNITREYE